MNHHLKLWKDYLKSYDPFFASFARIEANRGPLAAGLRQLADFFSGDATEAATERTCQKTWETLSNRNKEEPGKREITVLFLIGWTYFESMRGAHEKAKALGHHLKALESADMPPQLLLELFQLGKWIKKELSTHKDFQTLKKICPQPGPRRSFWMDSLAIDLAFTGTGKDLKKDWGKLFQKGPYAKDLEKLAHLAHALGTGDPEQAQDLRKTISSNAPVFATRKVLLKKLEIFDLFLQLQSQALLPHRHPSPPDIRHKLAQKETHHWFMTMQCLIRQSPQEAWDWAMRCPDQGLGFQKITLLRAAMSAGKRSTASALVPLLEKRGELDTYLLPFFQCRLALMEGETKAATGLYQHLIKTAQQYEAMGRVAYEIKLACELTTVDLFELIYPDKKIKPKAPVIAHKEFMPQALLGKSRALQKIKKTLRQFGQHDTAVLISGPTGSGKTQAARFLHNQGSRANTPFVQVPCGALPETLLASELFGHEKGAFTGAHKRKKGLLEEAGKGTLLLDDIGDAPPAVQTALLQVLEDGTYRPVGSTTLKKADCQILATTHKDLEKAIKQNKFRQDLYFRLARFSVTLPPLAERGKDILILADHFLNATQDHPSLKLTQAAQQTLLAYAWPGNIRELKNEMERVKLYCLEKGRVDAPDLSAALKDSSQDSTPPDQTPFTSARKKRQAHLQELFTQHQQLNRAELVKLTGLAPATLTKYLKILQAEGFIEKVEPKASPRTHFFKLR